MAQAAPFPLADPLVRRTDGRLSTPWVHWFTTLQQDVQEAPYRLTTVTVEGQTAAIGATALPLGALATGVYRVSYLARITTAATISSSLTVTLGFTNGGVACALSGAAMTGNTTTTVQSDTVLVTIDASTPLTYSTAYSSMGATAMAYSLWLVAEQVDA
jgi:hypothetical protein